MSLTVTQISTDDYILEELSNGDLQAKYFQHITASAIIEYEKTVYQLIHFLFQSTSPLAEIYRDGGTFILDLSAVRHQVIDPIQLEYYYPTWISTTGRENTMDEYGMLLDFIGHARQNIDEKYLLIVVRSRSGSPGSDFYL